VQLGENVELISNVHLEGNTKIGMEQKYFLLQVLEPTTRFEI
jgi:acyl-[acyl carrier protein]--UDP-N-acetylglucosamine O-acyltransferase